jgi:hypothetical protein
MFWAFRQSKIELSNINKASTSIFEHMMGEHFHMD